MAGFSGLQATTSLPDSRVTGVPQDNDNTSVEKPLSGDHLTQMLAVQAEMFQIQASWLLNPQMTERGALFISS